MSPAPLLLFLLATTSAALAHVLWGRSWLQIPVFWLAALAGSLIVYALPVRIPLHLPSPGGVPVLEIILGSWVLLGVASRLRL